MRELIGTLYFTPDKDDDGRPITKYMGTVAAIVIRRDDGSEFELRKESVGVFAHEGRLLTRDDMLNLSVGQPIRYVKDPANKYTVQRIYTEFGDVWLKNEATGKSTAAKYWDLKRA